jgi:septal ring factor EnvC (AmiA/AmiB activator)
MNMSSAIEKFGELETRIVRAVEIVKTTRQERDSLEKELLSARTNASRLERELEELRRERDLVKNKVEVLLQTLSELTEEAGVESEVATHRR